MPVLHLPPPALQHDVEADRYRPPPLRVPPASFFDSALDSDGENTGASRVLSADGSTDNELTLL
jgi:hypothetical protein